MPDKKRSLFTLTSFSLKLTQLFGSRAEFVVCGVPDTLTPVFAETALSAAAIVSGEFLER